MHNERVTGYRLWLVVSVVLLLACGAEEERSSESPLPDAASRLDELERRLLAADTVRFDFRVNAEGAVEAALVGALKIEGGGIELTGTGHFAGQPVEVFLMSDGEHYEFGDPRSSQSLTEPAHLREALLIGFTRMGILHNLARLTGGETPDHADGGVREWVTVDSVLVDPTDSAAISFGLTVAGTRAGVASLHIGTTGLPVMRRQTVAFPSGDMRVEERYSTVTIRPQ